MASKILMPNPCVTHVAYSASMVPRSHSSGQVCLPNKKSTAETTASIPLSLVSSSLTSAMPAKSDKTNSARTPTLARMWREVHGCNNWEGLVEPLHPFLRQEIIRYGEFVTACYQAFDLDPSSKRYLTCKYGKKSLLREVGMGNSCYEVTKYIYATPDVSIPIQNEPSCGRWIGYVAVSSDDAARRLGRRDIVITFRGTVTNPEWIANFMSSLTPAKLDPNNPRPDVKVESGFLSLYTSNESDDKFGLKSCREQLLSEVSRLLNLYKGEELSISLAGHSMGSSLALLLAYDIAELGLNRLGPDLDIVPVTVFSFGGPRVGNSGFKERCEELGSKSFKNRGRYEFPWSCSCYAHVGVEIVLDFFNMQNPSCVHDLGSYISLLRCPKKGDEVQKDEENIFIRARESILSSWAQNSTNMEPLRNAASNFVNLFQNV
uniref:Fungal lipase-type domain-containing protein n=1 Tax=Salix viminalis TaxID=40686 RepID=A0A6N2M8C2_SALVM